jgi:N-acetylneuraminic acid mutarotase
VPLAATTLSERQEHTAVWSGSQMIVWGGRNEDDEAFGDGMRYNLAGNTWSAMAAPPASGEPSERSRTTAIWTGDALVVWGGSAEGVPLRTGGIFRQATGWTNTPLMGAPSARFGHTAVWTGTEMLIWGGVGGIGTVPVNTGARFNVSSNRWFPLSTVGAPRARGFHTAVWTGAEMIIYGGYDITNLFAPNFLSSMGRYNPVTDTWSTNIVSFGTGRASATAIWTGTEMITWGGYSSAGLFSPIIYYNSGGRYNPASNLWTSLPAVSISGRNSHTAAWNGNEMFIWGGRGTSGPTNTGAIYKPASNSWIPIPTNNAPNARYGHTATWVEPPGQMFVHGGENGTSLLAAGGLYDPDAAKWITVTNLSVPTARSLHAAAWTGMEMLIFNGITSAGVELNTGVAYRPRKAYWLYQKP